MLPGHHASFLPPNLLILARSRGSEAAECLKSPEPALPELEISWAPEEREELGDEEKEREKEPEEKRRRNHLKSQMNRMSSFWAQVRVIQFSISSLRGAIG